MLRVDPRAGSQELIKPLIDRGLGVQEERLEYGDFAWMGQGPKGRAVPCAIELKTIEDVIACITSGRFSGHQLPGLQATYEVVYLMVEGRWTVGPKRELRVLSRGNFSTVGWGGREWRYEALDNWLHTLEIKAGVRVRRTSDRQETVQSIHDIYSWWTGREWEEHRSHVVTYLGGDLSDRVYTMEATKLASMLMAGVRGLGEQKARKVAQEFLSMKALAAATSPKEFERVEGIGPKLAQEIYRTLWSEQ